MGDDQETENCGHLNQKLCVLWLVYTATSIKACGFCHNYSLILQGRGKAL